MPVGHSGGGLICAVSPRRQNHLRRVGFSKARDATRRLADRKRRRRGDNAKCLLPPIVPSGLPDLTVCTGKDYDARGLFWCNARYYDAMLRAMRR
jgi:hypothetical protein